RPAHYLKRDGMPPTDTWMSNELLYRIPREPATEGIRALGRLALIDNYPALSQRIRQDLEVFLNDDALLEADKQTKLGIRCNRPRVFVASSLTGGTGSGMLIDLAYIIRHEMHQVGFARPELTGMLLVPPVDRTSPKNLAIANSCVTLAELHHFSQPSSRYETRFDSRQPTIADPDRPFVRAVMLSLPKNPSPTAPRCADRAAGLIYQETLTSIGRKSDEARAAYLGKKPTIGLPLQSSGCYRITWPRQRLLDTVSERLAARTLQQWCSKDIGPIRETVDAWFEEQWAKQHLDLASLSSSLEVGMAALLTDKPEALIDAELQNLPGEFETDPKNELPDIVPIVERLFELVGKPGLGEETTPGRFREILEKAAKPITKESEVKFARMAVHFIDQPMYRLAGAEETIRICTERLRKLIDELDVSTVKLKKELDTDFIKLVPLVGAMNQTGLFKGEKRRAHAIADVLNRVREWPRKRMQYMLSRCVASIYRQMLGNAPEYTREVALCRQRLGEMSSDLQKQADTSSDLGPSQDHPILPLGCRSLIQAADRLIAEISPDELREFEEGFQQKVRRHLRALVKVCLNIKESGPRFLELLLENSREFAAVRLGLHTPAEEFFRNRPDQQAAQREILLAYDEGTPEPFGPQPRAEGQSFVLGISDDQQGRTFLELAQELLPDLQVIAAPSPTEIVFYREYHDLQITDVPQAGAIATETVRLVKSRDGIDPHARTDVQWSSFFRE
ncbi:MAG: tubulin-like doman-containing protein, partial [Planctomycetes bacterium]|nr:tubulin-like doman-containing protein [Planctomycetota bacterium]